jgi:hypothetical protein
LFVVTWAALLSGALRARSARADGTGVEPVAAADADTAIADDAAASVLAKYAPPPMDGPPLRPPGTPNHLYVDATLATTDDLSALPYMAGNGRNLRFAAGGGWRWRQFVFTGEIPWQITTLTVTAIPGGIPLPPDVHQTATSLGDIRLGADWTRPLSSALLGGFGLRARLPTHTTQFRFHLVDGTLASYSFPYYFHLEPTAIVGGAWGRFSMVVNQGAIMLWGPDGDFQQVHIVVPTIFFWDAHYAVAYAPLDWFGGSLELGTDLQLNHVAGLDFQKLNDVRSAWLAPGLQFHVGATRIDAIARIGLTRGADLFGVIEYAGTSSYTVRVTRTFN